MPTMVSLPPFRFTAKPNSREKTIRGSMARRVSRPTKSLAVKKLTIISDMEAYSPISSEGSSVQAERTGGKIFTSTNMITAAIAPVTTKVPTVTPMILPARLRLCILATALEMDANTRGTTMQNIMLMNTVPRKLILLPKAGQIQPTMAPRIMDPIIMAMKR